MRSAVTGFLLLAVVVACTQKEKTNLIVTKDRQGNIVSEIHYIKDSLKHGLARYYYPNGDISHEIEYANGVREGFYKHYKSGKILEQKAYYKKGMAEGKSSRYYDNGAIRSLSNWVSGKEYGSTYFYYANSKIEMYHCSDFSESLFFLIKWDQQGKKTKEEGVVFSPNFYFENADTANAFTVNQESIIRITVADPPETTSKLWMGEVTAEGKVENFKELPIEKNTATYKRTFTKAGKYTLTTVGEIKDKNGKVIKEDRVTTDIRVVE